MKCYTFDCSNGSISAGIAVKNDNPLSQNYKAYISKDVFLQLWEKNLPEIRDNKIFDVHPVRIKSRKDKTSYFVLARPANESNDILVLVCNDNFSHLLRFDDWDMESTSAPIKPPEEIPTSFSISCPVNFSSERTGDDVEAFTYIKVPNKWYLYENGLLRITNVTGWRKSPCKYTILEDDVPKYVLSNNNGLLAISKLSITNTKEYNN